MGDPDWMELTLVMRKAITKAQVVKYHKATKAEKAAILDAICVTTGWHRDHARKAMRLRLSPPPPKPPAPARAPRVTYDEALVAVLVQCWAVLDGPCGKRLKPCLPETLDNGRRHGHLTISDADTQVLLKMSAATMDRRLAPYRTGLLARGTSLTRPGSMLKNSIPLKTWAEWDDTAPGFLEIDLVGHEGGDNNGEFYYSLDATDVATGWNEVITVRSKGERIVAAGLRELRLRFPFAVLGIHSDNGGEFINHHLAKWCRENEITFTRGRPSRSNDQAHVEQKNYSIVRRNVGYYRYDRPRELDLLNQLWLAESTIGNLFTANQKLTSKTRTGARVTKRHDTATTPLARILRDHPDLLDPHDQTALLARQTQTDLWSLRDHVHLIQANLIESAKHRTTLTRRAKRNHTYLSRTKMTPRTRALPDESTKRTTRAS